MQRVSIKLSIQIGDFSNLCVSALISILKGVSMDFEALNRSGKQKVLIFGAINTANLALIEWLLENQVEVFLAAEEGRDHEVINEIKIKYPHETFYYEKINYLDTRSISRFVSTFRAEFSSVDDIIFTDTARHFEQKIISAQGFEAHLAHNYVFPFAVLTQVLPFLNASSDPRIIFALNSAYSTGTTSWEKIFEINETETVNFYAWSQMALNSFMASLHEKLKQDLHPARVYGVDTLPYEKSLPCNLVEKVSNIKFYLPFLYAMTDSEGRGGVHVMEKCQKEVFRKGVEDQFLWNYSEELINPFSFFRGGEVISIFTKSGGNKRPTL